LGARKLRSERAYTISPETGEANSARIVFILSKDTKPIRGCLGKLPKYVISYSVSGTSLRKIFGVASNYLEVAGPPYTPTMVLRSLLSSTHIIIAVTAGVTAQTFDGLDAFGVPRYGRARPRRYSPSP
jgi:hypothetical protein